MIHPDHQSPDYQKNLDALQKQGFHSPKQEELPEHLQKFCGAETFLVNDAGAIKSVSQATGEIKDVPRTPKIGESNDNLKGRGSWFRNRHGGPKP
jgi:hypothetical protein